MRFLKTNSGKKGEGMPVVRNQAFYFKEGFCWSNTLNPYARLLKCRIKSKTINDVGAMSLTSIIVNILSNEDIVCFLNSNLIFNYYRNFINNTVNIQINDIRQIPVKIPDLDERTKLKTLFDKAVQMREIKSLSKQEEYKIQSELDEIITKVYL